MSSSAPARTVVSLAPQIEEAAGAGTVRGSGLRPPCAGSMRSLAQAVEMARVRFGEEAASDPYRGLRITQEQVESALATPAGTPLLFREEAPDAAARHDEAPALALLRDALELDAFDLDVLVIALAPELDLRYERLYGDSGGRRDAAPTDGRSRAQPAARRSAAEKLERRARFLPEAPLLRHGLIELVTDPAQESRRRSSPIIFASTARSCAGCSDRAASTRRLRRSANWSCRTPGRRHPPIRPSQAHLRRSQRRRGRHGAPSSCISTGPPAPVAGVPPRRWPSRSPHRSSPSISGRRSREANRGAGPSPRSSARRGSTALCSISTASTCSTARSGAASGGHCCAARPKAGWS